MDSSSLFNSYYNEYKTWRDQSKVIIKKLRKLKRGEKRKDALRKLDKKFSQMESVLSNMEHESQSNKRLLLKHRDCHEEFLELRNEYTKIKSKKQSEKEQLIYYEDEDQALEHNNRSRLLRATQVAEDQNRSIDRSLQILDEIDERSGNTLDNLVDQRGRIEKAIGTVQEIQAEGSQGGRIISRMRRRQITNKIIFLCIILVLIIGILIVLFFGVIKPFIIDPLTKKKKKKD